MRAYPATEFVPKPMLEIAGKTLIERNIEIMRDQLSINDIYIVVSHYADQIIDYLNSRYKDINLTFVRQNKQNGIGHALLTVEKYVSDNPFVVILGDELYINSDHEKLLRYLDEKFDAILMFRKENDKAKISCNYTGDIQDGRVFNLTEKPLNPETNIMGVGSYLLTGKVFEYIRATDPSDLRKEVEITDVLSKMAESENVWARFLNGSYINVNNTDDLNQANYILKEKNFSKYKISVVIPAYNEEHTIEDVIQDFKCHDAVGEVLVVNNNSKDKTGIVSEKAGARVVVETAQGYGCALKRGLDESTGDIIILTEADGSFSSNDLSKFLEYLKDCDMVIGTRTTRQMIEQGANMGPVVRWVNILYGKIIELLWWNLEPRFTDVGCTYRAIWKTSYQKIRPFLNSSGPEFAPEMMIAILLCRRRVIEIPVTYRKRFGGESKHSGKFSALAKTALKMLFIILKNRLGIYKKS